MKINIINLLILSFAIISCKPKKSVEKTEVYTVINPIVKDHIYTQEYVCKIQSIHYVEVRSRVKGYLEKIHVDEGQKVKKGQLLFSLNYLEFEKELQKAIASYKSAIADVKAAEVEMTNVKRLVEKDIVSRSELDMMKSKIEALKAVVEEALANKEQAEYFLSFSRIKAPYDGIINRIDFKVGSLIEEGGMLTSISDTREVFAYFNLSEQDYLNYITNGDEQDKNVKLLLANNVLYDQEGKIEIIESEFDKLTGNIAFRARFPNTNGILKHGANGKVVVNKQLDKALIIPQKSTFEIQDKLYVYVVKPDSTLEQRNIISRLRFPDFYIVEKGLAPDETIIMEGVERVGNGTKIIPDLYKQGTQQK